MASAATMRDAPAGVGEQEFKKQLYAQLKSTGIVTSLKSQLRSKLLAQLQQRKDIAADDPGDSAAHQGQQRSLWTKAMDTMVAEHLRATGLVYTLSVLQSEAGGEGSILSREELAELLQLQRQPALGRALTGAQQEGGSLGAALLHAIAQQPQEHHLTDSSCSALDGVRSKLQALEDQYMQRAHKERLKPLQAFEEQIWRYKQECEASAAAEVAAAVERVRELEVGAARREEAAKGRRALEAQRGELEKLHQEKLVKLRGREEEMQERLHRQQRDVENLAFSHRQRVLREEERLRGLKAALQGQLEERQALLAELERQVGLRQQAVEAREKEAEQRVAAAQNMRSEALARARHDVQADMSESLAAMASERAALESERARASELRALAAAELASLRSKEDRLRSAESARAEAEARAAAHAAGEEVLRLQLARAMQELSGLQQELSAWGGWGGGSAIHVRAAGGGAGGVGAVGGPAQTQGLVGGVGGGGGVNDGQGRPGEWRRRLQAAERQAEEATARAETAQRDAEEQALATAAARREVDTLKQQLTRARQELASTRLRYGHAGPAVSNRPHTAAASLRSPWGTMQQGQQHWQQGQQHWQQGQQNVLRRSASASPTRAGMLSPLRRPRSAVACGLFVPLAGARSGLGSAAGSPVRARVAPQQQRQATLERIAALSREEQQVDAQLRDFRRRAANQRAAAQEELRTLRGGGSPSAAAGASSALEGFDAGGFEAPASDPQLLVFQLRREALTAAAAQPPAHTADWLLWPGASSSQRPQEAAVLSAVEAELSFAQQEVPAAVSAAPSEAYMSRGRTGTASIASAPAATRPATAGAEAAAMASAAAPALADASKAHAASGPLPGSEAGVPMATPVPPAPAPDTEAVLQAAHLDPVLMQAEMAAAGDRADTAQAAHQAAADAMQAGAANSPAAASSAFEESVQLASATHAPPAGQGASHAEFTAVSAEELVHWEQQWSDMPPPPAAPLPAYVELPVAAQQIPDTAADESGAGVADELEVATQSINADSSSSSGTDHGQEQDEVGEHEVEQSGDAVTATASQHSVAGAHASDAISGQASATAAEPAVEPSSAVPPFALVHNLADVAQEPIPLHEHDVDAGQAEVAASATGSTLDTDQPPESSQHGGQQHLASDHGTTSDAESSSGEAESLHPSGNDSAAAGRDGQPSALGTLVPEGSNLTASVDVSSASGSLYDEPSEVLEVFAGAGGLEVSASAAAALAADVAGDGENAPAALASAASSSSGSVF